MKQDVEGEGSAGASAVFVGRLRRDLGTLESYAALLGILIGAGIFTVTSRAWALTGPSVILGYVVLTPVVLATSVAYAAFLSTPLGREPGGEYTHISRTLGGYRVAFIGAWLKIISYVAAGAYLANALADYIIQFAGGRLQAETYRLPLALASLVFFYLVQVAGVRWFGRLQVTMCALLGLSLIVLVVPGLFAIKTANYQPFVTHGISGFALSLVPLFFSFAGFESLAQTAGEVKDSTRRLPLIFLKGISVTACIYVLMSLVAFGVLPGSRLQTTNAPMAEVASVYLPAGAALFVTFGAIMAITTSMNSTMLVPSRLVIILARDELAPRWIGVVNAHTGTPIRGLTLTFAACVLLLVSGQLAMALNVAIFALVILYFIHSLVFLLLPRRNPTLYRSITVAIPIWLQRAAALVSLVSMGALIVVQVSQDARTLSEQSLAERIANHSMTSLELAVAWSLVGAALYAFARRGGAKVIQDKAAMLDQPALDPLENRDGD
ncbi:MAG: basic amino acid/polyamine antiporter, family [Acidobacteriota bacterium]|jgi:amino acid transporter|nr:basic amino acid/polyamine antiporter, family [Acidobacteriota bacterium]